MPRMHARPALPVVRTADLRRLLPYYRDVLGFQLRQQVPGVLALMRRGDVHLQLWQVQGHQAPGRSVVDLDACDTNIFRFAEELVRQAGPLLAATVPAMQAWGVWSFALLDPEGNEVAFEQGPGGGDEQPRLPSAGRGATPRR